MTNKTTSRKILPVWLGKLDAGTVKLKLAVSVVAVSSVHLLPASRVVEDVRRRCHRAGLQTPSGNAIRRRIRLLPVRETVKRRQGAKAARAYQMPVAPLAG